MRILIVALFLVAAMAATTPPRLETVVVSPGLPRQHSVSMRYLYSNAIDNTGLPTWGGPLEAQYQLPMSARVLYMFYNPIGATVASTVQTTRTEIHNPTNTGDQNVYSFAGESQIALNTLRLDFNRVIPGVFNRVLIRYQQPNLDVNPFGCGAQGNCRCFSGTKSYLPTAQTDQTVALDPIGVNGNTGTSGYAGTNTVIVPDVGLVSQTYFEHAPFAGQNPFLRTFRRICIRLTGAPVPATDGIWFDTNVFVAVVLPCFAVTALPAGMAQTTANLATNHNCAARATNLFAVDNTLAPVVAGASAGSLGAFVTVNAAPSTSIAVGTNAALDEGDVFGGGETIAMRLERLSRTTCCGSNDEVTAAPQLKVQPGVCINPRRTSCCGRRPFQFTDEQCCDRNSSSIRQVSQACPCLTVNSDADQCRRSGPNVFDATGRDQAGRLQAASGNSFCCRIEKFGGPERQIQQLSFCVSGDANAVRKCCTDGNVYDSSAQQCCPINGVQSLNIPCPCGTSNDCPLPGRQGCCTQLFPIPSPRDQSSLQCDKFAAYPRYANRLGATTAFSTDDVLDTPPVPKEAFRCAGNCYSLDYQICCNGRVCSSALERCCNDTCCNRYTSGCLEGRRVAGSRTNPRDWSVYYETCASIGALNGRKAFFVFILPTFMLFVTLLSLALVTVLARRATEHIFEMTERLLVALAVIETLLCCAFYFSPLYKNTVAVAFISLAAILIAVARKTNASLFLVFLTLFGVLYLVDPFGANIWLGVPSNVPIRGALQASSLPVAVVILFLQGDKCAAYYNDWFNVDTTLIDNVRHANPADARWGFCSNEWLTTLTIFSILMIVIMLLMLLLSVFSLVKKIAVKAVEPIELEVVPEPDVFGAPIGVSAPFY